MSFLLSSPLIRSSQPLHQTDLPVFTTSLVRFSSFMSWQYEEQMLRKQQCMTLGYWFLSQISFGWTPIQLGLIRMWEKEEVVTCFIALAAPNCNLKLVVEFDCWMSAAGCSWLEMFSFLNEGGLKKPFGQTNLLPWMESVNMLKSFEFPRLYSCVSIWPWPLGVSVSAQKAWCCLVGCWSDCWSLMGHLHL